MGWSEVGERVVWVTTQNVNLDGSRTALRLRNPAVTHSRPSVHTHTHSNARILGDVSDKNKVSTGRNKPQIKGYGSVCVGPGLADQTKSQGSDGGTLGLIHL